MTLFVSEYTGKMGVQKWQCVKRESELVGWLMNNSTNDAGDMHTHIYTTLYVYIHVKNKERTNRTEMQMTPNLHSVDLQSLWRLPISEGIVPVSSFA